MSYFCASSIFAISLILSTPQVFNFSSVAAEHYRIVGESGVAIKLQQNFKLLFSGVNRGLSQGVMLG